jgi:DNA invertase Pin-like site-specific DNA recombinase
MIIKYLIYARKSTDVEDKQVRSIVDQLAELREFARREGLKVVGRLIEKQSAKKPGRPIFNDMIKRIEHEGHMGILAWHPDRLARNSVDGGRIIYLVDTGKIAAMRFPTFWFEPTPQGKFMLNIAFGQSKYYVDSLAENTRRGLTHKAQRGEYPGLAPIGYVNNPATKLVAVDPKRAKVVVELFERYAEGDLRLEDAVNILTERGIVSSGKKPFHKDRVRFILANPFYCGMFHYAKELYEGKHQPLISKALFDRVQNVMHDRGNRRHKIKNDPLPFCGLLKCGSCGMGVSGEEKWKHQKNGNVHHYIYYRCTRKSKVKGCHEPTIRGEKLDRQISALLKKYSSKEDWTRKLMAMLDVDKQEAVQSYESFAVVAKDKIAKIKVKLQILLDSHLDEAIDRDTYVKKKAQLLLEKKTIDEKLANAEKDELSLIEPAEAWMKEVENLDAIADGTDLLLKKAAAKKIFGSHLVLSNRHARFKIQADLKGPRPISALIE